MQLVDIKSRLRQDITVNLSMREHGLTPALQGLVINRTYVLKDKVSGEMRAKTVAVTCPPAIVFRAGQELTGLPATVLQNPTIKGLLRRLPNRQPSLVVVKEYASKPAPAPQAAKKSTRSRK